MPRFQVIAFDADDTLWHNESLYAAAQARFRQLLANYHNPEWIDERLNQAEMRNIQHFGYGIKAFVLSMIETAVELTEGRITGREIQLIVDMAREILSADVRLLEHVSETIARLSAMYTLMLITKGDLREQEAKVARSGLAGYFGQVEIVSDKNHDIYSALLQRHAVPPERFLMVGNSLRSDILPVLALGASAVYIPYELTWAHEMDQPPPIGQPGYHQIEHLGLLPDLLDKLELAGA